MEDGEFGLRDVETPGAGRYCMSKKKKIQITSTPEILYIYIFFLINVCLA